MSDPHRRQPAVPLPERELPVPSAADMQRERQQLEQAWRVPRGLVGWFMVADHRTIGVR